MYLCVKGRGRIKGRERVVAHATPCSFLTIAKGEEREKRGEGRETLLSKAKNNK